MAQTGDARQQLSPWGLRSTTRSPGIYHTGSRRPTLQLQTEPPSESPEQILCLWGGGGRLPGPAGERRDPDTERDQPGPPTAGTGSGFTACLASRCTSPLAAVRHEPHITSSRTSGATWPMDPGRLRTPGPGIVWVSSSSRRRGGCCPGRALCGANSRTKPSPPHGAIGCWERWGLLAKQPRGFSCSHPTHPRLGLEGSVLVPTSLSGTPRHHQPWKEPLLLPWSCSRTHTRKTQRP